MKRSSVFKQADLTMSSSSLFKPSAPMALTTPLNRRQLLSGMAASATAMLLAANPLTLAPTAPIHSTPIQPMGAFEALRIFLQTSRIQR